MSTTHHEHTDVVITGCGVAGGMLAGLLAKAGLRTIAIEKRPRIGEPIRCAEAAGSRKELSRFIPVDEEWIAADIDGVRLEGPDGNALERTIPSLGVVLRRDRFDRALARRARAHGADIRTHVEAVGLERRGDAVTGIRCFDHEAQRPLNIAATLTVGADGVESTTARLAGLRRHFTASEIHSCYQYLMAGDEFAPSIIKIIAGEKIAPGGYVWIFPRGPGHANVGLGIHPGMADGGTAQEFLDRFVAERYPSARPVATVAGGTSGTRPLKTMVMDGLLLVGEGAGHNNPFSGGGIMNALEGAEEAAAVITRCFRDGDVSGAALREYDRRWEKRNGRTIARFAALRRFYFSLGDKDINALISILDRQYPVDGSFDMDYAGLFKSAIQSNPGLVWKARKLLW